jgi:hypothetical protein
MTKRIEYEFKTDKNGKEYANQINLKTGKRKRVPLKVAKKRAQDTKRREAKAKKVAELEKVGSNWDEYQTQRKKVEKRLRKEYKAEGKKARKGTIKRRAEAETTEKHVGVRSRYRMDWKFWEMPSCNTPTFMADAQAFNGDHFDEMVSFCQDIYNNIKTTDLCPKKFLGHDPVEGGCCVVVYKKSSKEVIKQFDIPKGVGCVR